MAACGALAGAVVPLVAAPLARAMRQDVDRTASALLGWSLAVLADLVSKQGNHAEAEACYRESLAIFSKQYEDTHAFVLRVVERLDGVLVAKGDTAALGAFRADRAVRLSRAVERATDALNARFEAARSRARLAYVAGIAYPETVTAVTVASARG